MKWFRMYHEARSDPKLESLTDAQFRVWHRLLCFASEQEERGVIPFMTRKLLAIQVAGGNVALLEETIAELQELEILVDDAGALVFLHFLKRQYDKPSDVPEAVKARVGRCREREKAASIICNAPVTPCNAEQPPCNDTDKTRVDKTREEDSRTSSLFSQGLYLGMHGGTQNASSGEPEPVSREDDGDESKYELDEESKRLLHDGMVTIWAKRLCIGTMGWEDLQRDDWDAVLARAKHLGLTVPPQPPDQPEPARPADTKPRPAPKPKKAKPNGARARSPDDGQAEKLTVIQQVVNRRYEHLEVDPRMATDYAQQATGAAKLVRAGYSPAVIDRAFVLMRRQNDFYVRTGGPTLTEIAGAKGQIWLAKAEKLIERDRQAAKAAAVLGSAAV